MKSKKIKNNQDLPSAHKDRKLVVFRFIAIMTFLVGLNYIIWRYFFSLSQTALWFSIPLILAETYSFLDSALFSFMMWKPTNRTSLEHIDATLDLFITTSNEPTELVRLTAVDAMNINWTDLKVYILDDGARPEMAGWQPRSVVITLFGEMSGKENSVMQKPACKQRTLQTQW